MPTCKLVKIGVWEFKQFVGVIIFGCGTAKDLGHQHGLNRYQVAELVRVALTKHKAPVSKMLSIAIRLLKKRCEGLRLLVSFADPNQGHVGSIYQAANWLYVGQADGDPRSCMVYINPKNRRRYYWRSVSAKLMMTEKPNTIQGAKELGYVAIKQEAKHKYLYPLDKNIKRKILPLQKPYPKRAPVEVASDQDVDGGATPTRPLQSIAV